MNFSQQRNLRLVNNLFSFSEMNNNSDFLVEQDCFSLEADVEEGIEEKWWTLAEHLLGEQRSTKYNSHVGYMKKMKILAGTPCLKNSSWQYKMTLICNHTSHPLPR